jgi:hypothetical protein
MHIEQVCLPKQHSSRLYEDCKSLLSHKEIALGAFLDIDGAFHNTSFNAIIRAARECGLEENCRWVGSMLESRLVHTYLMSSNLAAQVVEGCPQGEVLSPLL